YAGETLSLTRSFNNMIAEMKELIARLKMEEREKEALNYQMLLSQMNPHFLLNTLNTIKWIAMEREVDEVVHICVNLGKLLERSLRHDVELLHLRDALDTVQSYLDTQQLRYPTDKLRAIFEIDEQLLYTLVPKFT